jgi:drug/metabolite transporter (DMT)-like permease
MRIIFVWLLLCGIWGSTWIFIKLGLHDLPPVSFAAARFTVALPIIAFIIFFNKIPIPTHKKEWLLLGGSGFLTFCLNYGLLFWGEQFISSGLAAVLQTTIPAFGLLLAPIFLPERITFWKILSVVLGIIGISVIFYEQLHLSGFLALAGSIAVVMGSFSAALSNVLIKAFGSKMHPLTLTGGQMIFGFIPLSIYGLWFEGNPLKFNWTLLAVTCVLYLSSIGSIAAFWLYYWLLLRIEATKAMLIALVTPILAVIIGNLVLNEQLPPQTLFGGILVLLSVALVLFGAKTSQRVKEALSN